jgi:hypothetical protein
VIEQTKSHHTLMYLADSQVSTSIASYLETEQIRNALECSAYLMLSSELKTQDMA